MQTITHAFRFIVGAFSEKTHEGFIASMTRVVALLFAVVYCAALLRYASVGQDIGWPFALLGIAVLLAVPLQALFRHRQDAVELAKALLGRIGVGGSSGSDAAPPYEGS